jgi:hypothetical protein
MNIMKITRIFVIAVAAFLACGFSAMGQSYYEYKFIFNGTAYQTNGAGNIVGTPITDQTLLQSQAQRLNITNLSTISLVYHLDGGPPYGDTVDVISNATGETLTTEFGLYFGSAYAGEAGSLGRYAVTNAPQTEQRRVDQVYTFSNTPYTYENGESLGGSFTCKRFLVDTNGNTNMFIDGTLFWDVIPTGTNPAPMLCSGHFTLGQPLF